MLPYLYEKPRPEVHAPAGRQADGEAGRDAVPPVPAAGFDRAGSLIGLKDLYPVPSATSRLRIKAACFFQIDSVDAAVLSELNEQIWSVD